MITAIIIFISLIKRTFWRILVAIICVIIINMGFFKEKIVQVQHSQVFLNTHTRQMYPF